VEAFIERLKIIIPESTYNSWTCVKKCKDIPSCIPGLLKILREGTVAIWKEL
jgi:hypothetical protein